MVPGWSRTWATFLTRALATRILLIYEKKSLFPGGKFDLGILVCCSLRGYDGPMQIEIEQLVCGVPLAYLRPQDVCPHYNVIQ